MKQDSILRECFLTGQNQTRQYFERVVFNRTKRNKREYFLTGQNETRQYFESAF